MESHPCRSPPHALHGPSPTFQAPPSWFVPVLHSLQHIIHHSLGELHHGNIVIGRDSTPLSAVVTSHHADTSPGPSGPHQPLATLPRLPHVPHQSFSQLQVDQPVSSTSGHQTLPQRSTPPANPTQPLEETAELEPKVTANTDAVLQSCSAKPAREIGGWAGEEKQLRVGQLREGHLTEGQRTKGQLRAGQLVGASEVKDHKSAGKAEQQHQQQQQTVVGSKQQLQQPSASMHGPHRWSPDTSDPPPKESAAQPAPLVTEATLVGPSPQQPTAPAGTVLPPRQPRQVVSPNPRQASPDSAVTRAGHAVANSDPCTLRQSSTLGQVEPCIAEPPSRGKRPEAEKGTSGPAASQPQLKLPEAAPSSPAASAGAATMRNSDDVTAADPLSCKPAEQPLKSTRALASTKGASPAADASQLPSDPHAAEETLPKKQAQPLSEAPAHIQSPTSSPVQDVTHSAPRQRKRIYRQPSAATAEASPEAKRLKQEVQVKSEPPSPGPQQQLLRQQAKDTTAAQPRKVREPIRHPEQPIALPPSALQNIFNSIQKLRLQGNALQLTSQHTDLMTHLPPLLQLRVWSKYASEVLPQGNVVAFFSLTVDAMSRRSRDIKWLTQRESTAKVYRLCDAAVSLCGRLEACGALPVKTIPTKTPQMVPLELQAAYVLCVGGYVGSLSRREFADQLMVGLLGQVCIMLLELKASESDYKTAELNFKAAGGSPGKVQERLRQLSATRSEPQRAQHATRASEPRQLDIGMVVKGCLDGMMRLKHIHAGLIDDRSMDLLQKQDSLWQLRIVSFFSCNLRPTANASAFLTTVCKLNRDDKRNNKIDWLRHTGQLLHQQTQSALGQAHKAGILAKGKDLPAKIVVLPKDLHHAAACYAIAAKSPDSSSDPAAAAVEDFVKFAQGLIREVDPAAVPNHRKPTPESASQSAVHSASHAASQPPRNDKHDKSAGRHSNQRSPAAGTQSAPKDPRTCPPSQAPHRYASASQHPDSSGREQQHRPHQRSHPPHCKYFYRIEGNCTNSNCDYHHGSHQEYVAYMQQCGLVPYSLKFASKVGRDKWIVDAAVDILNDMILSQQLPRGSFSECDLRPLAFLQDPSGEHAQLQLQVSLADLLNRSFHMGRCLVSCFLST